MRLDEKASMTRTFYLDSLAEKVQFGRGCIHLELPWLKGKTKENVRNISSGILFGRMSIMWSVDQGVSGMS